MFADGLRLTTNPAAPSREIVERLDAVLQQGPAYNPEARAMLNVLIARAWERLGELPRAARAATRAATREVLWVMPAPAFRELGRLQLAAGDSAEAARAWRFFLNGRRAAEPPERKADDLIRARLAELERARHQAREP